MLGRSAGISVLASHAPLQYRKKSSPAFTAGSIFPTTTPATPPPPLLPTPPFFPKILLSPLPPLFLYPRHCPNTHSLPLKRQNLKKGSMHARQNLLRSLEGSWAFSSRVSAYGVAPTNG